MLNELVLKTIIDKFDIIFLELEDNRLIQFKSLTFPQLHLVDLVGSIKTDGFFCFVFLHNACTPTLRHKLSEWLSILVSYNRHSEQFVIGSSLSTGGWVTDSWAVNDHWRSRCDSVFCLWQTSVHPGHWLLVCRLGFANNNEQMNLIMLGWWIAFGFMHKDASSNCNGISFGGAFLKFYVHVGFSFALVDEANAGED